MKGFTGFESWDETYVHTKHNEKDRTVLEYRVEGDKKEPWTWVRTQGKGRVFYTAWGHDQRTWGNPGFQELVERGIRWTVGQDPTTVTRPAAARRRSRRQSPFDRPFPVPEMTAKRTDVKPFEYDDVGKKIPNYRPRGGQGEPLSKMQKPLPAEESQKHIVVPKGFRAELFVTEKELGGKPICMTWDERGRLWAALTMDYPNELNPPAKGRDKIVFCEDTDGDGQADKVTVFAEGLSIPTQHPLRPRRRDRLRRHADRLPQGHRRRRQGGRPRGDVRHLEPARHPRRAEQHAVRPGQLGVGDAGVQRLAARPSAASSTGSARGSSGSSRTGRSWSSSARPNNNTWGLGMSEEGIIFGSTANGNPSEYMPIPNRYYEAVQRLGAVAGAARDRRHATGSSRSPRRSGRWTSTAATPPPPGTRCTPPGPTRRSTGTGPRS